MLQEVSLGQKSLADYTHIAGKETIERIRELAEPMKGHRVLHVSATAFGGGVSEILYTIVPLMRDIGIDAHWHVIFGKEEFFNATKLLHNSLQGAEETLSDEQWQVFDEINAINADGLQGEWDTVIVHDPQPIGLRRGAERKGRNWIWRCHIDLSEPNPAPIARLLPMIEEYDATVWHLPAYVPQGVNGHNGVKIIPPAIDPLSPKNMAFSPDDAAFVCRQFGIDVDRPLLTQVSRFDPWKDPMGVIDAYRIVHEQMPDVQLALVGSMATDDPEGWEFFQHTFEYADGDDDIKILNNLNNVGAIEVNAFQSQSDVCLQKSIREGFGLTVTEALWKGRPTVAGNVGGIPLQIADGESGYLVNSPEECAQRCLQILADPELGMRLGRAGKEHARQEFLSPRLLRDWVELLSELDT
ncbi:MAG TPA: glycosyltransferase [Solirubrobacterales bacterium]|nr:glycosyltransferase [Solirubrobacterales bacterium]